MYQSGARSLAKASYSEASKYTQDEQLIVQINEKNTKFLFKLVSFKLMV